MQYVPLFLRIQLSGILSLCIVLYGVADYLLLPAHLSYKQIEQNLQELQQCTNNLGNNLGELKNRQKLFREHRSHLDACYDSMESLSLDPLEWLHNVSQRSGLKILTFQDKRHGIINSLPAVDIDMKASGSYEEICNFLHYLERSSRPCFINRFHIAQKADASEDLVFEARFLVFPISREFQDLLQNPSDSNLASIAPHAQETLAP